MAVCRLTQQSRQHEVLLELASNQHLHSKMLGADYVVAVLKGNLFCYFYPPHFWMVLCHHIKTTDVGYAILLPSYCLCRTNRKENFVFGHICVILIISAVSKTFSEELFWVLPFFDFWSTLWGLAWLLISARLYVGKVGLWIGLLIHTYPLLRGRDGGDFILDESSLLA